MNSLQYCCEDVRIPGSWPRWRACGRKAKVERDGKHYCGTHDPVARKAKAEKRDAEQRRQYAKESERRRLAAAAPELAEACETALEHMEWSTPQGHTAYLQLTAALRKARGEG